MSLLTITVPCPRPCCLPSPFSPPPCRPGKLWRPLSWEKNPVFQPLVFGKVKFFWGLVNFLVDLVIFSRFLAWLTLGFWGYLTLVIPISPWLVYIHSSIITNDHQPLGTCWQHPLQKATFLGEAMVIQQGKLHIFPTNWRPDCQHLPNEECKQKKSSEQRRKPIVSNLVIFAWGITMLTMPVVSAVCGRQDLIPDKNYTQGRNNHHLMFIFGSFRWFLTRHQKGHSFQILNHEAGFFVHSSNLGWPFSK